MYATGRYADTKGLALDKVGIALEGGKIPCKNEATTVPSVFAVGDVVKGTQSPTTGAARVKINRHSCVRTVLLHSRILRGFVSRCGVQLWFFAARFSFVLTEFLLKSMWTSGISSELEELGQTRNAFPTRPTYLTRSTPPP